MEIRHSQHFVDMLEERRIEGIWVDETVSNPERTEEFSDGTLHLLRRIPERQDRWLRVIVNVTATPPIGVTAFFDRRLRSNDET